MDLGLRGRNFLIVGASRGVGAALARLLVAEGARVALVARNGAKLSGVVSSLACHPEDILAITADARCPDTMQQAVAATVSKFGGLHGLVVLAGGAGVRSTFLETDDTSWEHHFQSTLMVSVRACRSALPELLRQSGSAIVLTAAYSVRAPMPPLVAYTAMKAAVASMAKNIAKTYGSKGLRCNAIAPGIIDRDAVEGADAGTDVEAQGVFRYEQVRRAHGMTVALGRAGRHGEFAEAIAWLLSDRAGYVSGSLLNIDGGTDF